MNEHPSTPDPAREPVTPVDAGSQALAEALHSSFAVVKIVMVILVVLFFASGFFTVQEQERAIILRFGKPVGEGDQVLLKPGLHFSWPYPIEEYRKVSVAGIQKVTSRAGWYFTTPEQELSGIEARSYGNSLDPNIDGYALTADGNIIHTRATLLYHIKDPVQYVFGFVDASNAVQNTLDNALLQTAARFNVDDILTRDVAGYRDAVRRRVTELLELQKIGVAVEDCIVQSIPPRQLKNAFDSVVRAAVERNKVLNEARSHENQVIAKAGADAASLVNSAESDRALLVREIAGESERFNDILPQYRLNPALFMQQRLAESFSLSLTNVEKWMFPTGSRGNGTEVRLLLNRKPPVPKSEAQ